MKKGKIIGIIVLTGVISFFVIPISYALYKKSSSISGTIYLSNWNVSLNQNDVGNHLAIIPEPDNINDSYTLNITSNSEVDVMYSIIIDGLPTGVSVKADNGNFIQESNHRVVINDAGTIYYNDVNRTKTCVLTFKASSTTQYVDNQEVNISVIFSQSAANS